VTNRPRTSRLSRRPLATATLATATLATAARLHTATRLHTAARLTSATRLSTATRLAAAGALGAALLAGCSSEGASTQCGLDQCTVTFDRGVEGSASVLGVDARFVGAQGDQVTIEVAGEQLTLTAGQAATEVGGLSVSVASVTESQAVVRISRAG
jgi:hypothetical protein